MKTFGRFKHYWLRWRYRRHAGVGHPDDHDGCRACRTFLDRLDRIDPAIFVPNARVVKS